MKNQGTSKEVLRALRVFALSKREINPEKMDFTHTSIAERSQQYYHEVKMGMFNEVESLRSFKNSLNK